MLKAYILNKYNKLGDYLWLYQKEKHQSQKETSGAHTKNWRLPILPRVRNVAKRLSLTMHARAAVPTKGGP
jgi:hypothetical protein